MPENLGEFSPLFRAAMLAVLSLPSICLTACKGRDAQDVSSLSAQFLERQTIAVQGRTVDVILADGSIEERFLLSEEPGPAKKIKGISSAIAISPLEYLWFGTARGSFFSQTGSQMISGRVALMCDGSLAVWSTDDEPPSHFFSTSDVSRAFGGRKIVNISNGLFFFSDGMITSYAIEKLLGQKEEQAQVDRLASLWSKANSSLKGIRIVKAYPSAFLSDKGDLYVLQGIDPSAVKTFTNVADFSFSDADNPQGGGSGYVLVASRKDGTAWYWGAARFNGRMLSPTPVQIPNVSNIKRVFANFNSLWFVTQDGHALLWPSTEPPTPIRTFPGIVNIDTMQLTKNTDFVGFHQSDGNAVVWISDQGPGQGLVRVASNVLPAQNTPCKAR